MKRSFYHFLMTQRGYDTKPITNFANAVSHDIAFPKQSEDYHELSNYLEMETDYLSSMAVFDSVWELYLETDK